LLKIKRRGKKKKKRGRKSEIPKEKKTENQMCWQYLFVNTPIKCVPGEGSKRRKKKKGEEEREGISIGKEGL